jgi:hypothetical protein
MQAGVTMGKALTIHKNWQLVVPEEMIPLFDLRVGDIIEWRYDENTGALTWTPKRAKLITDDVRDWAAGVCAKGGARSDGDDGVLVGKPSRGRSPRRGGAAVKPSI